MANIIDMLGQAFTPPELVPTHKKRPEQQLADAIAESGMIPPDDIRLDGAVHRFSASGKKGDERGEGGCGGRCGSSFLSHVVEDYHELPISLW